VKRITQTTPECFGNADQMPCDGAHSGAEFSRRELGGRRGCMDSKANVSHFFAVRAAALGHSRDGGRPSWRPVVEVVLSPLWHQGANLCPGSAAGVGVAIPRNATGTAAEPQEPVTPQDCGSPRGWTGGRTDGASVGVFCLCPAATTGEYARQMHLVRWATVKRDKTMRGSV
jgi:hypothetical protein